MVIPDLELMAQTIHNVFLTYTYMYTEFTAVTTEGPRDCRECRQITDENTAPFPNINESVHGHALQHLGLQQFTPIEIIRLDKDCGLLHPTIYLFLLLDCLLFDVAPSLSLAFTHRTTYRSMLPQHHLILCSPSENY